MSVQPDDHQDENAMSKIEDGQIDRNLKSWKGRRTTEKSLWVMVFILFALLLILLGFLIYSRGTKSESVKNEKQFCITPKCVEEAYRILRNGNFMLDPCKNFSNFACGTFQERSPPIDNSFNLPHIDDERFLMFKKLLEESSIEEQFEAAIKAKIFYKSCINADWSRSRNDTVMELLKKAGLTNDPMSDVYKREKTLALLSTYRNKNLFFTLRKKNDIIELYPGRPVIKSVVLLDDTSAHMIIRMKYESLINDTFVKLGMKPKDASIAAEKLVNFEKTFAKLTTTSCLQRPIKLTLRELEELFSELKWTVLVKYMYEFYGLHKEFSNDLKILLMCEEYLNKLFNLWENVESRVIDTFIAWSFAVKYLPLLDPSFRQRYRDIEDAFDDHWSGNIYNSNTKMCLFVTGYYFSSPLAVLYQKEEYSNQTDEGIQELFGNIQTIYEQVISSQKWLNESSKTQCKTTIRKMQIKVGLPPKFQDLHVVNTMYSLINMTDNIIENILAIDRAIYAENIMGSSWSPLQSQPMDTNLSYDSNTFVVSFGVLLSSVYSVQAPSYLNYGRLGFIIAQGITQVLETIFMNSDFSKKFEEKRSRCLSERILNCPSKTMEMFNRDNIVKYYTADRSGLLVAYKAYQKYVQLQNEMLLPGTNFTSDQLFFVSFGQMMCQFAEKKFLQQSNSNISNMCRSNNAVQSMPQFSEEFNCPKDSPMNRTDRCSIWE